jgi:hypothetical protein
VRPSDSRAFVLVCQVDSHADGLFLTLGVFEFQAAFVSGDRDTDVNGGGASNIVNFAGCRSVRQQRSADGDEPQAHPKGFVCFVQAFQTGCA